MDWWLFTFLLGAILSLFLPIVPVLFQLFLLLLLAIMFFCYKPLRTSSGLLFGAVWILFNAWQYFQQDQSVFPENKLFKSSFAKQVQLVEGEVLSLQTITTKLNDKEKSSTDNMQVVKVKSKQRFNLKVTRLNDQYLSSPFNIRLSWNKANFIVSQGQLLRLKVKMKPAHGLANLGAFNYKAWLNSKGIMATGYVTNKQNKTYKFENSKTSEKTSIRQQLFYRYQEQILKQKSTENYQLTSLMFALGFGERGLLTTEQWQVLQATGTGHLIAISGLHIGLVASGSFFLVMFFVRFVPFIPASLQAVNIRYYAIVFSLLVALTYGYLAGFALPTVRALVMLSVYWLSRLLSVKLSIKRWLLITIFLLLLISPFSLFTASFWLSVYAVTIIFLTLWRFDYYLASGHPVFRFVKGLLIIQLSLTLLLLPVSALFFQQISSVAMIANIVAVPWMSFLSIPLTLLSVLAIPISDEAAQFLIMLNLQLLSIIWQWLNFLAEHKWALVNISAEQNVYILLTGSILMLALFFPVNFQHVFYLIKKHFHKKIIAIFTVVLLLFSAKNIVIAKLINIEKDSDKLAETSQENKYLSPWQIIVFDVGQGLSVLIRRDHHAILYDTGASYPSGFNMTEAVILPYLQHENIKQLDKVFISHGDNDHAGGLKKLTSEILVSQLITNVNKDNNSDLILNNCYQGQTHRWQGLSIEVLWPRKNIKEVNPLKDKQENDDSCVISVFDGKHRVILTGDISKKVEQQLIIDYPSLKVDVLLVPHHGSNTSSSKQFIQQLSPSVALTSAGFLNRWKMPTNKVIKRYQENNTKLLNTATSGQIIVTFENDSMQLQTYRDNLWPFWFAN